MKTENKRLVLGMGLGLVVGALGVVVGFGPLNPPGGAVTGTAKPLAEVEPRIALGAANTPGDANSVFRISAAGSYYLTGNVSVGSGRSGIEVGVSNVTIDLNGFSIVGSGGSLIGVTSDVIVNNLTVRNGVIRNLGGTGGVNLMGGSNRFRGEGLTIVDCSGVGILVGDGAVLESCIVHNMSSNGVWSGDGAVIGGCVVSGCGSTAILTGAGSTVSECTVEDNTSSGISTGTGSEVRGCVAYSNGGSGIIVGLDGLLHDCVATFNEGDGVVGGSRSVVRGNTCANNGDGITNGSGVRVSNDCRVEGNHCGSNYRGIEVTGTGSVVVRNTCSNNVTDFVIATGNRYGPIVNVSAGGAASVSGSTAASTLLSMDANANYAH